MSISRKKELLRDISMLIRRESIFFEPNDRIPLENPVLGADGLIVSCSVGSVYYNQDLGMVCFRLYDDDGFYVFHQEGVISGAEVLSSDEMRKVADRVSEYVESSVYRAKNVSKIGESVDLSQENSVYFLSAPSPEIFFDVHRDGQLQKVLAEKVFRNDVDGALYVSGISLHSEIFSCPLSDLSDIAVMSVRRSVERNIVRLDEGRAATMSKKVKGVTF